MAGNIKTSSGLISVMMLLFLTTSNFKCGHEEDPEYVDMIFILPFSVSPGDSIILKSDTLWVEADMPDTILEKNSSRHYKLVNFNFKTRLGLFNLFGKNILFSDQPGAIGSFEIVNKTGSYDNLRDTFGDLRFIYEPGKYKCKIGLIPRKPGVFCLNFLMPIQLHQGFDEGIDLRGVIDLGKTPDGRERIPVYRAIYYLINEGETNFPLFLKHSTALSISVPTEINIYYEQKGTFTFRVIE